jgi:hypothetical protein
MLTLIVTEASPSTEQCVTRMVNDVRALRPLSAAEIRNAYVVLEYVRDELSKLLDRADNKRD